MTARAMAGRHGPRGAALMALLLALAGCASPAPEFAGAQKTMVTREGRDFAVFRTGNRVEVIRLGWAGPAERRGMLATMLSVAEQATGCTISPGSVEGDTGELRARIRCRATTARP